uniref:Uncharacterized protein n=1 Tax=viral metagenome TaxID=1070528 RepID=A0A6C0CKA3_9ZZZZ
MARCIPPRSAQVLGVIDPTGTRIYHGTWDENPYNIFKPNDDIQSDDIIEFKNKLKKKLRKECYEMYVNDLDETSNSRSGILQIPRSKITRKQMMEWCRVQKYKNYGGLDDDEMYLFIHNEDYRYDLNQVTHQIRQALNEYSSENPTDLAVKTVFDDGKLKLDTFKTNIRESMPKNNRIVKLKINKEMTEKQKRKVKRYNKSLVNKVMPYVQDFIITPEYAEQLENQRYMAHISHREQVKSLLIKYIKTLSKITVNGFTDVALYDIPWGYHNKLLLVIHADPALKFSYGKSVLEDGVYRTGGASMSYSHPTFTEDTCKTKVNSWTGMKTIQKTRLYTPIQKSGISDSYHLNFSQYIDPDYPVVDVGARLSDFLSNLLDNSLKRVVAKYPGKLLPDQVELPTVDLDGTFLPGVLPDSKDVVMLLNAEQAAQYDDYVPPSNTDQENTNSMREFKVFSLVKYLNQLDTDWEKYKKLRDYFTDKVIPLLKHN